MPEPKITARVAFLDYLRIFAFLSVLVGHKYYSVIAAAAANSQLHATLRLLLDALMPFIYGGGTGVVVFFLISGYIISEVLSYERPTIFLVRRVFRIYPLYVTAVLIQMIVQNSWHSVSLTVLVPQLLLMGDFFGSPYTLFGVEWTLRIEMVFYVFMAILKVSGFWDTRRSLLIIVLLVTTVAMSQLPAFPNGPHLFKGYVLIYGPFLFVGAAFWLYEQKYTGSGWLLALIAVVFANYFYLLASYQPQWLNSQFAALGFMVFTLSWIFRSRFRLTGPVLLFSNLTYSVYLFHDWIFDIFRRDFLTITPSMLLSNIFALIALFVFCLVLHRIAERPINRFGRAMTVKGPIRVGESN